MGKSAFNFMYNNIRLVVTHVVYLSHLLTIIYIGVPFLLFLIFLSKFVFIIQVIFKTIIYYILKMFIYYNSKYIMYVKILFIYYELLYKNDMYLL